MQRALGAVEDIERALDGGWSRDLGRRGIDDLDQRPRSGIGVHDLREQFGRQIEINTAWTPGEGRADRARHANADICGMQHAKRRLAQRPGNRKLVHLLVVALLQVDDLALGRAADQDHRKAVGRGIGQRSQAVEKTGSRDREADAGLLRQEAGDGGGIAGMLLVPEREDAHACRLRLAPQVGDRDARHPIDRVDVVELERIDDEMKTVRELWLRSSAVVVTGFGLVAASAMIVSLLLSARVLLPRSAVCSISPSSRHISPHARQGRARDRARGLPHGWCRAPRALR